MMKRKQHKPEFKARVALEARQGIGEWMIFYNHRRPHAAHGGETPVRVYRPGLPASGPGLRPDLRSTDLAA